MASRIAATFERLARSQRTALIPYVTAGDPSLFATRYILDELATAGADVIELGVPFSDPMADGPAICEAMERALKDGTTLSRVIDIVRDFRSRHSTPIVLFGYMNPLFAYGLEEAARDASEAGVDAFLVVDLPPEEAGELTAHTKAAGLDFIGLFTPTSDEQRVAAIGQHCSGFAYYVSMLGVTGGAVTDLTDVRAGAARVREATGLPTAVGFGIRSPHRAFEIGQFADGVVVGSALIRAMSEVQPVEAPTVAAEFIRGYREALDQDLPVGGQQPATTDDEMAHVDPYKLAASNADNPPA